jgi:NAD(P)-dependent dehydrogenase (short-subunit alcohol dehydrogenase family)
MGNNVVRAFTGEEEWVDTEPFPNPKQKYEPIPQTDPYKPPQVNVPRNQEVVLVLGGTGVLGKGIIMALLEKGHIPIVPSRYPDRLLELQQELEEYMFKKLGKEKPCYLIEEDISTERGAMRVRDLALERYGRIDRVVSTLACRWPGRAGMQCGVDELRKMLECVVMVQYIAAKVFLPLLAKNKKGSYTIVTGRIGEACPKAEHGFSTIGSSALFGLVLALKAEAKMHPGVVVNEARVGIRVVPHCSLDEEQTVFGEHQAMDPLEMGCAIAAIALSDNTKNDYPPFYLYSPEELRDVRHKLEPEGSSKLPARTDAPTTMSGNLSRSQQKKMRRIKAQEQKQQQKQQHKQQQKQHHAQMGSTPPIRAEIPA